MKRLNAILPVFFLLCGLWLLGVGAAAQDRGASERPVAAVEWAFGEADVDSLAKLCADRIEISLLGKSRLYSRSQARYVLRDFFEDYPPVRVSFAEPSTTQKGIFAAGTYLYAADREPLRLYLRLRRDGSVWAVRELVIERAAR